MFSAVAQGVKLFNNEDASYFDAMTKSPTEPFRPSLGGTASQLVRVCHEDEKFTVLEAPFGVTKA